MSIDSHELSEVIFYRKLAPLLKNADKRWNICFFISAISVLAGIAAIYFSLHILIILIIFIIGFAIFFTGMKKRRKYFRTVIIPQIFDLIYPDLNYCPDMGLSSSKFASYGIYNSFDRFNSEDKISGSIGKTSFQAAEVHLEKEYRRKNGKSYRSIFRGVVFTADFNKHISGRTIIFPDLAERYFGKLIGGFLQDINPFNGSIVKLEDHEFEKYFAVYSNDDIEARYILTPGMMERLTSLRKKNKDMRILFEGDHIVIALSRPHGWLEPPLGKLAKPQVIENIISDFTDIINITEDLDLNTRIWTKQ